MEFSTTNHWETLPNRDQVLEKVYDFFDYLSKKETKKASALLLNDDFEEIQKRIHDHLLDFAKMNLEDEEFNELPHNLAMEVNNPYEVDETLLNPEFSGRSFITEANESMTLNLAMRGMITQISVRFRIVPQNGMFYLQLEQLLDKKSA